MGQMSEALPQGPMVHCGDKESHGQHANPTHGDLDAYCDGVTPLEEFVEITVRVPLSAYFGDEGPQGAGLTSHREVIAAMADNNEQVLGWFWEMADDQLIPLRVRACGEDRFYQCQEGKWPSGE